MSGRTHRKLVALLEAEGFSNVVIHAAQGHWRTSPYADVWRWEGSARYEGAKVSLGSWDTMTECVKHGIVVERDPTNRMLFDVSRRTA